MTDQTAWLIEAAGPCYIGISSVGGGGSVSKCVRWTDDANKALRFSREEDADAALYAFRGLMPELFPTCFPTFPKAVEHGWLEPTIAGEKP